MLVRGIGQRSSAGPANAGRSTAGGGVGGACDQRDGSVATLHARGRARRCGIHLVRTLRFVDRALPGPSRTTRWTRTMSRPSVFWMAPHTPLLDLANVDLLDR